MVHKLNLMKIPFNCIKKNRKKYEIRLNSETRCNIKVNDIGKPTNIANNITPTKIKPNIAGSINSAIIFSDLATHLFWLPNNFLRLLKFPE